MRSPAWEEAEEEVVAVEVEEQSGLLDGGERREKIWCEKAQEREDVSTARRFSRS